LAGRDLGLMIFAREPFGKFPHIAQKRLIGSIGRIYRDRARHCRFSVENAPVGTPERGSKMSPAAIISVMIMAGACVALAHPRDPARACREQ
jgi:hypothetical protein